MQPVLAAPRQDMDASTVDGIVRVSPAITIGRSLELVDWDLNVIDTVPEIEDGTIRRNSYADNHATATLKVGRELDWGAGIVRPVVTLSDGVVTVPYRLGAYFLPTPSKNPSQSPETYDVECVDFLDGLSGGVSTSFSLPAGKPVLEAAEEIVQLLGYTKYVIDQSAISEVIQSPGFSRPITEGPTWRGVLNDLMAMVGYAGVWSDWDGVLRMEPYVRPQDRDIEWTYHDGLNGMIQVDRELEDDYYGVPNEWTFYRNNLEEGQVPLPGNGIYTYRNESNGRSSVEARGRVISAKAEGLEAASQASLEAAAQSRIDADMSLVRRVTAATDPHPGTWHFDTVWVDDAGLGPAFRATVTEWSLGLRSRTMSQTWTVVE